MLPAARALEAHLDGDGNIAMSGHEHTTQAPLLGSEVAVARGFSDAAAALWLGTQH
jgi:hypothetical protein